MKDEVVGLLSGAFTIAGNDAGKDVLMIDCTAGEGGHSEAFLAKFSELKVIACDADRDILGRAQKRLEPFAGRVEFYRGWAEDFFRFYPKNREEFPAPDVILIDLGVSLYHYEQGDRGFSFAKDEALDMRIDTGRGEAASEIIARLSEAEIAALLWENAEERYSRRIARAIARERARVKITSSVQLAGIVSRAVPFSGRRRIHPATKTFAALRIAVNNELERLPFLLQSALRTLKTGGRLGVISFHSLEDRIVKNYFRQQCLDCVCPPSEPRCICRGRRVCRPITSKPVIAGEVELAENHAARSAKLRVVEKVYDGGFPPEDGGGV